MDWDYCCSKLKGEAAFETRELEQEKKKALFQEFQREVYFSLQKGFEGLIEERTSPRTAFN